MGLLDRFRRKPAPTATEVGDRRRLVSSAPDISAAQEKMNRDLMESQMTDSRAKRDAEAKQD